MLIFSSPYVRCLMTAKKIADTLGIAADINVDSHLAEYMEASMFAENPIP